MNLKKFNFMFEYKCTYFRKLSSTVSACTFIRGDTVCIPCEKLRIVKTDYDVMIVIIMMR